MNSVPLFIETPSPFFSGLLHIEQVFFFVDVISFGLIVADFLFGGGEYFLLASGVFLFIIEKSREYWLSEKSSNSNLGFSLS